MWTRDSLKAAGCLEHSIFASLLCSHGQLRPAGILWTGHNDGRVCAFALDASQAWPSQAAC